MTLDRFIEVGAAACGVSRPDLTSRKRRQSIVEAREILAWLGVMVYGFKVREMAVGFEKYGETASRLVSRASNRRLVDEAFAGQLRRVDKEIGKGEGDGKIDKTS